MIEDGKIPFDIYMGMDGYTRKSVFVNYCSSKCQKKDKMYLWNIYDNIIDSKKSIEMVINNRIFNMKIST